MSAECLFSKGQGSSLIVVIVYVDEMVIMSESKELVQNTKADLKRDFKITDLGPLSFFLGIKFERFNGNISMRVTQGSYIERILEKFKMQNCRPVDTPTAANFLSIYNIGPKHDEER